MVRYTLYMTGLLWRSTKLVHQSAYSRLEKVTGISGTSVDSLICVRVSLVVHASELFWVRQFASVFNSTAREIVILAFILRWFGAIPFLPVFSALYI